MFAVRAAPDVPRPPRVLLLPQRQDLLEVPGQGPDEAVPERFGAVEPRLAQHRVAREPAPLRECPEPGEAVAHKYAGRCLPREGELVARHLHVLEEPWWREHVQ